jgi:hypothetical protein
MLGHVGKVKFPLISFFSYKVWMVALLLVSGCEGRDLVTPLQSGRVFGVGGLEGRWVGAVSPDVPECGRTTTGLMNIGQGEFGFAPFQNTVVIRGKIGPDDRISGVLERVGGERQLLTITLDFKLVQGSDEPDRIDGLLVSGRCRWRVRLTRG